MARSNRQGAENFYLLTSNAGIESKSGLGSYVRNTEEIRDALPALFKKYDIRSIVDCPCGDWNWMRLVPLDTIDYLGLDIIPALIHENRARYQTPLIRFGVHDMIRDPLPSSDLVICRDFLFHLSLDQIKACMQHIFRSGSRFLLTTSFPWIESNPELTAEELDNQWGWRMINVERPPIGLKHPVESIRENETCRFREMRLYSLRG